MVETDIIKVNKICAQYKFSNLVDLRLFVNGTWFTDYGRVEAATGLSEAQLNQFYDNTIPGSFGSVIQDVMNLEADVLNFTGCNN